MVFTPLLWIFMADEICNHKRTNIRLEGWWLEGGRTFHSLDQIKTSKQIRRDTFKCLQLPPTSSLHFWLQLNWRNKCIYRTNKQNPAFNSNSLSGLALDNKSKSEFWETTNWIKIFKYGLLGLISLFFLLQCFTISTPKPRVHQTDIALTTLKPQSNPNTPTLTHHHRPNQRSLLELWVRHSTTICTNSRLRKPI